MCIGNTFYNYQRYVHLCVCVYMCLYTLLIVNFPPIVKCWIVRIFIAHDTRVHLAHWLVPWPHTTHRHPHTSNRPECDSAHQHFRAQHVCQRQSRLHLPRCDALADCTTLTPCRLSPLGRRKNDVSCVGGVLWWWCAVRTTHNKPFFSVFF